MFPSRAGRPALRMRARAPSPPRRPPRCDTRPRLGVRIPGFGAMGREGSREPGGAVSRAARAATRRPPSIRPVRFHPWGCPRLDAPSRRTRATTCGSAGDLGSDPAPHPPPTIAPIFPTPRAPPLARETAAPTSRPAGNPARNRARHRLMRKRARCQVSSRDRGGPTAAREPRGSPGDPYAFTREINPRDAPPTLRASLRDTSRASEPGNDAHSSSSSSQGQF